MKIIIHLENLYRGGIDTFILSLIKNWPDKKDTFLIITNLNHPSNVFLKKNIGYKNKLVSYDVPLFSLIINGLPNYLNIFIIKILIFLYVNLIQFIKMYFFFSKIQADTLIVVNGGYPGGETSRLSNIIWKILGRKNNFHNLHNLAVFPRRLSEKLYESVVDYFLEKTVDKFICVSKVSKIFLEKRKIYKNSRKILSIYNGLKKPIKNNLDLKKKLSIPKNSQLCLVIASYEPRKGHTFLIDTFNIVNKTIKNLHLVFIGDLNDFHLQYFNNLKQSKSTNIHFLKFIPNAAGLIKQSDILLLGSQEYESFGLVALEGMIQKVPIVATNIDAFLEIIGKNDLGIIRNKKDINAYASQIIKCLTNNKFKKQIINYGTKRVQFFSEKKMSLGYYKVFNPFLKNQKK